MSGREAYRGRKIPGMHRKDVSGRKAMAHMICPVVRFEHKAENTETHQLSVAHNHSVILNHFCCFICFSKNHSSYGGVRVGWWVKVQLSIVYNVSVCVALRLSAKNTIRMCSFSGRNN